MASSTSLSNTPAASHSVRRPRRVVSLALQSRAATSHEQPVTSQRGSLGSSPGPGWAAGGSPVGACRAAVVVGGLRWPSRALRRHGDPWRARRPPVDSLKKQNPKYCYFEHGYFKPGGVGCQTEPFAVSGPRHSNAAEPRSPPRSQPWACRYPAAWSSGGPAAATLAATATATHHSSTGPT